jgi:hypothetical protein
MRHIPDSTVSYHSILSWTKIDSVNCHLADVYHRPIISYAPFPWRPTHPLASWPDSYPTPWATHPDNFYPLPVQRHNREKWHCDPRLGSPYKSMQVAIFIDFWHSAAPNFAALMAWTRHPPTLISSQNYFAQDATALATNHWITK